jgi:hypothetical protein
MQGNGENGGVSHSEVREKGEEHARLSLNVEGRMPPLFVKGNYPFTPEVTAPSIK